MALLSPSRRASFVALFLLGLGLLTGCTRTVLVAPEKLPPLLRIREQTPETPAQVRTVDGELVDVRMDFKHVEILPEEGFVFLSPPGHPSGRNEIPVRAAVMGERLVVLDPPAESEAEAEAAKGRPLAYRTEDIRAVAIQSPDPGETVAVVLGTTVAVALVASLVTVVVVGLTNMDGMMDTSGFQRGLQ